MKNKGLLLTFYILLLTFIIACGRRGAPVAIIPAEEAIEKGQKGDITEVKDAEVSEEIRPTPPGPPTGLMAIYTQKSIILTWDEITEQDIKGYNVYRSSGEGFRLVGKTITPAFTDSDVKPDKRYLYRVTAIGESEGEPSKEIEVLTKSK